MAWLLLSILKKLTMLLSGKARESFEKDFVSSYKKNKSNYFNLRFRHGILENFYKMPLCLQFGAYVDWFQSTGINIGIFPENKNKYLYGIFSPKYIQMGGFQNVAEARIGALAEAEVIYNNRADLDQIMDMVFDQN